MCAKEPEPEEQGKRKAKGIFQDIQRVFWTWPDSSLEANKGREHVEDGCQTGLKGKDFGTS